MFHVSPKYLARTTHVVISIVANWDKLCEKDGGRYVMNTCVDRCTHTRVFLYEFVYVH